MPNIVTLTPSTICSVPIPIGERGENVCSAVRFDFTEWADEYGEGAVSLLVKRKGDTSAYPVVVPVSEHVATWTISNTDTAVHGYGKAEFVFTLGDLIAKTAVFSIYVANDIGPNGEPPEPIQEWMDELVALGGETLINAQAAQAAQEAAETAQSNAETAATNAATSATNAAQSAGAARFAAESALASSDSASASATAASGHATAAEAAKDLAISAAESAQHSETQAELSASAAAESAESASGSAAQAQQSASNASQSATQASNSATNAASSATSASESAERAESAAASVSAIQLPVDTASGSIASFSDGASDVPVKALSVALEPIQNLNGQSSPYPSGGGKQMIPLTVENIKALNTAGSWSGNAYTRNGVTFTITLNAVGAVSGIRANGTATGTVKFIFGEVDIKNGVEYVISGFDNLPSNTFGNINPALTGTSDQNLYANKTGTADADKTMVVSFYVTSGGSLSNKDLTPMVCVSSASNPTVFAPYENICPITGHTQAQVWRAGVNVWDEQWVNGFINDSGVFTARNDIVGTKNAISVKPNTTYAFVRPNVQGFVTFWKKAEAYNELVTTDFISRRSLSASVGTFTAPDNCYAVHFNLVAAYGSSYANNVSVNYPSTNTAYIAHKPIVNIEIPLGQTVYGGTIDVVGGVCRSNMAILELGNLNWTYDSGYNRFNVNGAWGQKTPANNETKANIVSDRYKTVTDNQTASTNYNCSIGMSLAGRLDIRDESFGSDVAAFKASLSGAQLCYELATPIEIPLTEQQLSTLYGQNNVWSDSGDTTVEYRADIGLYIQKMIAEALT